MLLAKRKKVPRHLKMRQTRMMKTIIVMLFLYQFLTNIKVQEHQFQQKLLEFITKRVLSNQK